VEFTRTFAFREVQSNNQTYFEHFKLSDNEESIVPVPDLLTEWEHWELLTYE